MIIYRFRTYQQYLAHLDKQAPSIEARRLVQEEYESNNPSRAFTVSGFSITAQRPVKFLVDWHYSNGSQINWRERMICPLTELNNRQRASYHLLLSELHPYPDDVIYITESVTNLYRFLALKLPHLCGSEFVDAALPSGHITEDGIRNEDLTQLSFANESLDKIISFDCLEHIPNVKAAISECYRVLKPGGAMLLSFPFNKRAEQTEVRAEVLETGEVLHHCEPEYHGDPLSNDGCLSYYTFGWDVLEWLKAAGFEDAYATVYWSDIFGYLGDEQIAFVVKK